jgi:hypothetical protein
MLSSECFAFRAGGYCCIKRRAARAYLAEWNPAMTSIVRWNMR